VISVLIVEDEPLIAEAHRAYLDRLQGFSVTAVAHTARDAMRAASDAVAGESPIDLVLLDIGRHRTSSRSPPNAIWRWCAPP
jgi:response regulator of citrate/malate metabolism